MVVYIFFHFSDYRKFLISEKNNIKQSIWQCLYTTWNDVSQNSLNWQAIVKITVRYSATCHKQNLSKIQKKCFVYTQIQMTLPARTKAIFPLQWRHNEHVGVSNHQPPECLRNSLFRHRSKKTSKLRVTGLCVGNLPVTGEFPAQMASNAKKVPIWWRRHASKITHWAWVCWVCWKAYGC